MNNQQLINKTLELIESYSVELGLDDDDMLKIYMWAHTANKPECRKNHPSWMKDLLKAIKKENKAS